MFDYLANTGPTLFAFAFDTIEHGRIGIVLCWYAFLEGCFAIVKMSEGTNR